jgi:pimeloyl-ACP methyl ester carboxylesterase
MPFQSPINRGHLFAVFTAGLLGMFVTLVSTTLRADEAGLVPNESSIVWGNDDVVMVLKADSNGNVRLRDFVRLLGERPVNEGPSPLQGLLPDVVVDLNRFSTRALISGANVGLGDKGQLTIETDVDGNPMLRLRGNLKFLKTQRPEVEPTLELDDAATILATVPPTDSTVMLFIHGFHGKGESFVAIREHFRTAGYRTGCVHYDDHVSIARSASKVAAMVKQQFAADTNSRLVLVGHSMGGLVAREWVENPELTSPQISHLITVGSPHSGSAWAEVTPLPDLLVNGSFTPDVVIGLLSNQSTTPSAVDLRPHSEFLTTLASRPRCKTVHYTTVIGTGNPIDESTRSTLREQLLTLQNTSAGGLLKTRIENLLSCFDEVCADEGDGVVSVDQAKIPDVNDIVYVDCSHWEFFDAPEQDGTNLVWDAIGQRIGGAK